MSTDLFSTGIGGVFSIISDMADTCLGAGVEAGLIRGLTASIY